MTKEAEKHCQKCSTSAVGSTVVLVIRIGQTEEHRSETRWHDKPSVKGNVLSGSQSRQIRVLYLVTRAISEISELSHGTRDRRPRDSKCPSLQAMCVVFSAF